MVATLRKRQQVLFLTVNLGQFSEGNYHKMQKIKILK